MPCPAAPRRIVQGGVCVCVHIHRLALWATVILRFLYSLHLGLGFNSNKLVCTDFLITLVCFVSKQMDIVTIAVSSPFYCVHRYRLLLDL